MHFNFFELFWVRLAAKFRRNAGRGRKTKISQQIKFGQSVENYDELQ